MKKIYGIFPSICFFILLNFSFCGLNAQDKIAAANDTRLPVEQADADSAVFNYRPFSETELKTQWSAFKNNKGWAALMKEVEKKGFVRIEKSSWGYNGTIKNTVTGKSEPVLFCAFDFYSPSAIKSKTFQTCSMIWRKVGDDLYIAYIVFPKGVSDKDKSFAAAEEWFADAAGTVQKAQSFNKCFTRCIQGGRHSVYVKTVFGTVRVTADCKSQCLGGIAICGGVTAILQVASGGLGTPLLIATFGICAGVACGQCFAMCAIGCQ